MAETQKRALLFLVALGIAYGVTKWSKACYELPVFFRDHFTDLLFIPFQMILGLIAVRFLKRDLTIRIHFLQVFLTVAAMSALFEWYLPTFSREKEHYTADTLDTLMYVSGGLIFLICQQFFLTKRISQPSEKSINQVD